MWPLWNSKAARRENVVRFAFDAATLAFGALLADDRLVRAMRNDAYVLGYVLARLRGLTNAAAADARLGNESAALNERVLCAFFGEAAAALSAAAAVQPSERARHLAGASDGFAQCDYLFGARDVREHPYYPEALLRERAAAAAMPGNRFNGTSAAIAHHLEHFTFMRYVEHHHPPVVPARACSSAA